MKYIGQILITATVAGLIAFLLFQSSQPPGTQTTVDDPVQIDATAKTAVPCNRNWPNMAGPTHDSRSCETGLDLAWLDTGPARLWEQAVGGGYSVPVVQEESLIIFGRYDDWEVIESLDVATGEVNWQYGYPTSYQCKYNYSSGPYSTPAIDQGAVFALGAEGLLHCLDLVDGRLIWQRELRREFDIPEPLFAVGHSPLVADGVVYLNLGAKSQQAGVIALDALTGETIWTATDQGASYATPRLAEIHGNVYLFVFTAAGLVSLNPQTGHVHWSIPFGVKQAKRIDAANAVTPLVYEDYVLVTAGPGVGSLCLRILPDGNYEKVWQVRRALDSQFNNLVCIDGYVYGFTSKWRRATLNCIELATGDVKWKWHSDLERGSSLAADGRLILLGEYGHLASLERNPDQNMPIAMTAEPLLEHPCYSAPALSQGRLYLRNEQRVLCLDLRSATEK